MHMLNDCACCLWYERGGIASEYTPHGNVWPSLTMHTIHLVKDWSSPQEFWDLYDADTLALAEYKIAPPTSPKVAWVDGGYCDKKDGDLGKV